MTQRTSLLAVTVGALTLAAAALFVNPSAPRLVAEPAPSVARKTPEPTPIGRAIDDFLLYDVLGRPHALAEWSDRKLIVVAFLGAECPLSKLYGPRLDELAAEFGPRGVAFVGVDANVQDSLSAVAAFTRRHAISFPI